MVMDKKINKYIEETNQYLDDNNIGNNYCIIIYCVKLGIRQVKFIYNNISTFEKKAENDVKKIESGFGIDFQLWIFD